MRKWHVLITLVDDCDPEPMTKQELEDIAEGDIDLPVGVSIESVTASCIFTDEPRPRCKGRNK